MLMYLCEMFGVSLLLTECIEIAAAACMGVRKRRDFLLIILVNCLTNPLAVYLILLARIYGIAGGGYQKAAAYIIVETLVVVTEGFVYHHYMEGNKHPFLFSMYTNGISFVIGCLI